MENSVTPGHSHPVNEVTARNFSIDPATKEIRPQPDNLTLAQRSHNSDRFVFTIPATTIDGHDMTACNSIMIHFQNISQDLMQRSRGIYKVTDLAVKNSSVTLSWLIGEEATLHVGSLIFSIHFACTDESGKVVYNFPTLTFARITVGATIWNSETIAQQYPDIIAEFESRIANLEDKLQLPGGGGGGVDFTTDDTLKLENGILSVNTTGKMEQDNTLPITSAGVFATVGNIEALLKTI